MTTTPTLRMPPRPPSNQTNQAKKFTLSAPQLGRGHRALLYGPGGIGKTTLACLAPGPVAFVDLEESLGVLSNNLREAGIEVPQVLGCSQFNEVREALQSNVFDQSKTIVVDSGTRFEDWTVAHTIRTVKGDRNSTVQRLEDYGFGKGYQHVFETWLTFLADLDRHTRAGRNVILIAHDSVNEVPNPAGADWKRYEPRLQDLKSGKASIRLRTKEWSDHTLFLGYDVAVDSNTKKAQGHGTRTLYTAERPFCMAKSRTTDKSFDIELGSNPWAEIFR